MRGQLHSPRLVALLSIRAEVEVHNLSSLS